MPLLSEGRLEEAVDAKQNGLVGFCLITNF